MMCVQVNAEAIKIGKEAEEANAIASECQAGLDKALPALQAAEDALNVLTKKDMSELKVRHTSTPALIHAQAQSTLNKLIQAMKFYWLHSCSTTMTPMVHEATACTSYNASCTLQ